MAVAGVQRARPDAGLEPWQDPSAEPFIRIANVTKRFGEVYAVDNVALDIFEGEFFALLGPSGCGKTTLLRMLAGFETPTQGRIMLDGNDMSAVPPYRRPVNMMFQSYALFPHMNVEQNIAFGLRQDRLPKDEIDRRVDEVLDLVRLTAQRRRRPDQMSGGQRQRVALARAIVKRPKLILLDEPLAALDKKLREATQFELCNIQESLGLTFVIVTHDQEEAMTVATRIAIMNEGQVAQVGTPSQIYEYPQSRFVADFMGEANIVHGRVSEVASDHVRIEAPELANEVIAERTADVVAGQPVWLAFRPEKVGIRRLAPVADAANTTAGQIVNIGYLGDVSIYHVRLRSGLIVKVTQANLRRLVERPFTWDDEVELHWEPDAAVVLRA